MGKSDAYALKVVGNELWQEVGRHFLTSTLHWWVSRFTHIAYCLPAKSASPSCLGYSGNPLTKERR